MKCPECKGNYHWPDHEPEGQECVSNRLDDAIARIRELEAVRDALRTEVERLRAFARDVSAAMAGEADNPQTSAAVLLACACTSVGADDDGGLCLGRRRGHPLLAAAPWCGVGKGLRLRLAGRLAPLLAVRGCCQAGDEPDPAAGGRPAGDVDERGNHGSGIVDHSRTA